MLAHGLKIPSLGVWQHFSRVMFEELQAEAYAWSFGNFAGEFESLDRVICSDKTNVIAFRNRLHMAPHPRMLNAWMISLDSTLAWMIC